jgi:hypothetical protein
MFVMMVAELFSHLIPEFMPLLFVAPVMAAAKPAMSFSRSHYAQTKNNQQHRPKNGPNTALDHAQILKQKH